MENMDLSKSPVFGSEYMCEGHGLMAGACCQRCGLTLQTDPDAVGRVYRIGQVVSFRNRNGVPHEGTILEIHDGCRVKVKYCDRAWSSDTYDETVDLSNIATDQLELSYIVPRSRKRPASFAKEQSAGGGGLKSSMTAEEKKAKAELRKKECQKKKKEEEKKKAVAKNAKLAKRKAVAISKATKPVAVPITKLTLRKSIPPIPRALDEETDSTATERSAEERDENRTDTDTENS